MLPAAAVCLGKGRRGRCNTATNRTGNNGGELKRTERTGEEQEIMGENGEDGRERRVRKRQGEDGRWRKGQREPEKEKKRKLHELSAPL